MEPVIFCLINQKGGCGKSSTCFHLAGHFAGRGLKTLLVDADPQGSLSQAFFGSAAVEELAEAETLVAVFDDERCLSEPGVIVAPTGFENLAIVRANQALARFNTPLPETTGLRQLSMREFLRALGGYEVVLVDCPPNLYQCSWNAMIAADHVVIPVPPEDFGTQGLRVVHQAIENARLLNPRLSLLGHVIARFDGRLTVHRTYARMLRDLYGDAVLDTVIPEASAFKVALACRRPVGQYDPACRAALTTSALGEEILGRAGANPREWRAA